MEIFLSLLFLLLLVQSSRLQNATASCEGLKPYQFVSPSAAGRWYLVKATQIGNVTEDKNTCGFFNTIAPCKCIGVNVNSSALPPNVMNYTLQNFGYNEKFNSYTLTKIQLSSLSNNSLLFNAEVPLAKVNFTIAILGTDAFLSWITLAMCEVLKDAQGNETRMNWIITRSPLPTQQTIGNATQALTNTSNSSNGLRDVSQLNCPPGL